NMFQKVLIGYDGSRSAQAGLHCAVEMAMDSEMELAALWVREPLPLFSDLPSEVASGKETVNEHFKKLCGEIRETAKDQCLNIQCVARAGRPAKTIVQHADEGGYDLIVIGHSSHSEWWGRLLGNTADRIADPAHCSVPVVKN
ncbi:MAG TPA: universal stress protein, partial [Candidatus Baltobacteraceae bacterium]|nr:universal stress protein [Candidatus Baltobacteraceae bacterium]